MTPERDWQDEPGFDGTYLYTRNRDRGCINGVKLEEPDESFYRTLCRQARNVWLWAALLLLGASVLCSIGGR